MFHLSRWTRKYFITSYPEFFCFEDKNLKSIKKTLNVLASETFSAVSAPIQYAAIQAFEGDHKDYIKSSREILKTIGNYVYDSLNSNKILINKSQGGFYLLPEFVNAKFKSSSEMCDNILNETGVALLPGSDFGFDEERMLARLSFTDFDGENLMKEYDKKNYLDNQIIEKIAPKVAEGVDKLKKWSESL